MGTGLGAAAQAIPSSGSIPLQGGRPILMPLLFLINPSHWVGGLESMVSAPQQPGGKEVRGRVASAHRVDALHPKLF